jgi:nucleotidyltransferase substrate binding protein (TIGR01987 family)
MSKQDIRWKQRFANYQKALAKLQDALDQFDEGMTDLEKEGMIQRFEYTYELAWKTLQDLLYERGYTDIKGPTLVLQQSLRDNYITEEEGWRKMKAARELTSHTYDEHTANTIVMAIRDTYFNLLSALQKRLVAEFLN